MDAAHAEEAGDAAQAGPDADSGTDGAAGACAWQVEIVDEVGETGHLPSLAIDAMGAAHIGYVDRVRDELRHATDAAGGWTLETVAAAHEPWWETAIAIEVDGRVHMVSQAGDLLHMTWDGGEWLDETMETRLWVLDDVSLALDHEGHLHVSYYMDQPGDGLDFLLVHSTNADGAWLAETVEADVIGYESSITVDEVGTTHIAYEGPGPNPHLASEVDGAWVVERPLGMDCHHPSLATGPLESLHLACEDGFVLRHATNATGAWVTEAVEPPDARGFDPSLAIDERGAAHVAFRGFPDKELRYATNAGGSWSTEVVDDAVSTVSPALALDSRGLPRIAYVDLANGDLRFARRICP